MTESDKIKMITPMVFPFTFLPPAVLSRWKPFLGTVAVYQPVSGAVPEPVQEVSDQGRLTLRFPVTGDEEPILRLAEAYERWGTLHSGARGGILRFLEQSPSVSNQEGRIYTLGDEIRRRIRGANRFPESDPLRTARLFLLLAQKYDTAQWNISDRFDRAQRMEKELFKTLRGENEQDQGLPPTPDTPGIENPLDPWIQERLLAWSRLMLMDPEPSCLCVTPSHPACRMLIETLPEDRVMKHVPVPIVNSIGNTLSADPEHLFEHLQQLAVSPRVHPAEQPTFPPADRTPTPLGILTVYTVLDTPPQNLFAHFLGTPPPLDTYRNRFQSTLLLVFEPLTAELTRRSAFGAGSRPLGSGFAR